MRVLMIGPSLKLKGGMSTVISKYFQYDFTSKYDISYISTTFSDSNFKKYGKMIRSMFIFLFKVGQYDIVHIHCASKKSFYRKSYYILVAKLFKKSVILHVHGGGFRNFYEKSSDVLKKYIKFVFSKTDKVLVLSKEWFNFFQTVVDEKKIEILYNGVDVPNELYLKEPNSIVFIGTINEDKGIFSFVKIFSSLLKDFPQLKLIIAGSGENNRLKKMIQQLKLNDSVISLGWIDSEKKNAILKKTKYFVLPSKYEGMPMALLEALSYGCIPFVSNVGGIPEVIDNRIGVLFDPNDLRDIEVKIKSYLTNTKNDKQFELARQIIIDRFSLKEHYSKLNQIYVNLLG